MNRLILATLLALSSTVVFAQAMKPPKQVADLAWMVGTWSGSTKVPYNGHDVLVKTTMVASFDGQVLKEVSTTEEGGKPVSETMMLGWDPDKHEYFSYTFTSFAPMPGVKHGSMSSGNLVMASEPWKVAGQTVVSRETYVKESDARLRSVMEFKNGRKWDPEMSMVLTKLR
jgi:hypothetical protein